MNWKQLLVLLILAGVGLLLVSREDSHSDRRETIPEALHGVWQTRDPSYAGRYIELDSKLVVFGVGAAGYRRQHGVIGIEPTPMTNETLFTLVYLEDDGSESQVNLVHSAKEDQLRFTSRPHVRWQRQETLLAEDAALQRRAEEEALAELTDPLGKKFDQVFAGSIWEEDRRLPEPTEPTPDTPPEAPPPEGE